MATPSDAGSTSQAGTSILRDRRNWIAFVVGLVVVVAGVALVWPKSGPPAAPEDFCSFIGRETLAKYVPNPELSHERTAPSYTICSARSSSRDVILSMSLSREENPVDDLADMCRRERLNFEDAHVITPPETAEFGDRMCGIVDINQYHHDAMFYVVQGGDLISVRYVVRAERGKNALPRALELTRLVFAKLR
ncbi:hypothetical protein [Actinopolymorpha alba]|uniref:hypothetical protein n=1 Tax=Actinopolymorpha alba TaxID=533267 RepID=UPI000360B2B5|nr:hypothetical protein [Actinopolymorpha alba]